MVSPGKLRLISNIYNTSRNITRPTIGVNNMVKYPTAEEIVDDRDLPIIDTLDALAERGILKKVCLRKGYICPSCNIERMSYSRACPDCESIHTVGRVVACHPKCQYSAPAGEFEQNGRQRICYNCGINLERSELEYNEKHFCRDCGMTFSQAQHQVQCRVCFSTYLPKQVSERTLYEYNLTSHGRAWYHIQMMTRNKIHDRFKEQDYAIDTDITVTRGTNSYPIHIYAEHTVFDVRLIAGIYDIPELSDLDYLQKVAKHVSAHPVVVITVRSLSKQMLRELHERGMGLLVVQQDGSLGKNYMLYNNPPDSIPFTQ